MAFRSSFRLNIIVRVAALAGLMLALLWSLLRTGWDAVPVTCAALVALLVIELVRYVESGTRDLATLLRSVAAGDFTTASTRRSRRPPFADYEQASRSLIQTYQRLDLQRAASDELLRAVIEHVSIAVLCFAASGRMAFANPEARRLLGLKDETAGSVTQIPGTDPRLPERLLSLQDDERAQIEVSLRGDAATLLLHARRFTLLGESFTVVVCHDIRQELETRDVQAWQALTRVLTHEMMNSLTPIVTLSGHLRDTLGQTGADAAESIEVIHERSSGLARFIEAYRQFSHPPVPAPAAASVAGVLERVARLKKPELDQLRLRLDVANEAPEAMLHADARQVEQVMINLVRNAQQALAGQGDGCIELRSAVDPQGHILIHVTDNGPGIEAANAARVFMPFFTTRSGGTGIGLALSRQLMQLNHGSITMTSEPGRCRLTLRLPAAQPADS